MQEAIIKGVDIIQPFEEFKSALFRLKELVEGEIITIHQARVIQLRLLGLGHKEVAKIIGISVKTSTPHYYHCIERLKNHFAINYSLKPQVVLHTLLVIFNTPNPTVERQPPSEL
jgi:hypothetical protein